METKQVKYLALTAAICTCPSDILPTGHVFLYEEDGKCYGWCNRCGAHREFPMNDVMQEANRQPLVPIKDLPNLKNRPALHDKAQFKSIPENFVPRTLPEEERKRRVETLVALLGEYGDAIQVLISWVDPADGTTHGFKCGEGNWYARVAIAAEFVLEARVMAEQYIIEVDDDDDEDDYECEDDA